MQDFRLYQMALTNRDIFEVWSGKFPQLRIQSECRCPGSHPRVHPLVQRYCIPNGADDTTNDRVLRLNPEAHPLSYINDNDIGTTWISSIFSTTEHLRHGVTITIDLENGQFQFFSPQPEAIRIQRKKQPSIGWEDWQYFARDCSVFGMENNGSLQYPDSVNCLQLPSHTPYSNGNTTFSVLNPEPNHRPGYNDFYNTPSLQEFVKVSKIKIHLYDQYHTTMPWVNAGHRYYGIDEITISGRNAIYFAQLMKICEIFISNSQLKLKLSEFSRDEQCDRCQPLYNDKPFHPGDQVHAYNCKPCQCFSHAVSCHYNRTIDYFPNEYYRGGGGVCDNCQHNTSGRNCELCNDFFYRHIDADLSALDICKPCECYSAGTKNGSCLCNKITEIQLEENVIAKDMCLVDNAINARKDFTICKSSTLMAAALVAVMPLGQLMEILPVTKIQASASAKKMLLGHFQEQHVTKPVDNVFASLSAMEEDVKSVSQCIDTLPLQDKLLNFILFSYKYFTNMKQIEEMCRNRDNKLDVHFYWTKLSNQPLDREEI
ncbi:hypothetical protein Chor_006287 [Crotalus horridus]